MTTSTRFEVSDERLREAPPDGDYVWWAAAELMTQIIASGPTTKRQAFNACGWQGGATAEVAWRVLQASRLIRPTLRGWEVAR